MKIKVSAGFSGVIATGSYQNARPSYTAELEIEVSNNMTAEVARKLIEMRQTQLQEICYRNFKQDEQIQTVERINRERKDIRFYDGYPSVTSIIGWDADFYISPEDLAQYASQGNITHAQVAHFITTGKWAEPKEIEGTWADIVIIKKGKLQLSLAGWDFPTFLKQYPLEKMENGVVVKSHKHKCAGTPDIRKYERKGKKGLADVKRTPDKLKNFKQMSAYIMMEEEQGESPYDEMMIIPLNAKTKQGFSKPVICEGRDKIKQYQDMFLRDRKQFHARFGV